MTDLKGKRVLIFQQRGWALNVGHFLARKLKEEGAVLAALTAKRTTHDFVLNQKEVRYELVFSSDEVKSRPEKYLGSDRFTLAEICRELGIDSVWPLVAGARNHVRSYRDKYYYGFKQNVSDEGIVLYVQAVYKYIRFIFSSFKPDVIVAPNFPTLHHLMVYHYAKKRGVRMLALTDSKVPGVYIFSNDYNYETGRFHERVHAQNEGRAESANREKARAYIALFRKNFKAPEGMEFWNLKNKKRPLWQKLRTELSPFYHILKWYLKRPKNFWESIGPSIDYKPPRIILRDHYCYRRYRRFANTFPYYPFTKLGRYAYFPLQVQPEEAIDIIAPFSSNQIETARQIAMSLPDDYTLAVREHPAMVGLRPPSYLEKLDRTPNVKLIDYRIPNETALRGAEIVICPNGTSIAEAAYVNKPAIQLGNLGTTLLLPNTVKHTDMTTLAQAIKRQLSRNLDTPEYEERLENFVAAAFDTGIEKNYIALWERGEGKSEADVLWQAYKNEIIHCLSNQPSNAPR